MGVYIKGMEMPTCCYDCMMFYTCDFCNGINIRTERAYDCPLIPVPDHGDLIDRDALCIRGGRNCGKMFLAELLKNAPVVILAERNVKVCPLYSDDEVTEYCVEGPCTDEMEGRCPIAERSGDERK